VLNFFAREVFAQTGEALLREHGIVDLILGATLLVKLVLGLLVFFSVVSWGIIFFKMRQLRSAKSESDRFIGIFWDSKNLGTIHEASKELSQSPVAQVFRSGYEELLRVMRTKKEGVLTNGTLTTDLGGIDNVGRAMKRASTVEITKLERALTFLATTASSTPFIGLFGTVWGIMNAFRGLSVAHSSSIQAVAPGIAEALVATAAGLAAAIPALVAYNHFGHKVKLLAAEMDNFAHEFLNIAERHFLK
jgi:biopolymer transport protein TolQ